MKKLFLTLGVIALLFTSCSNLNSSNDDSKSNPDQESPVSLSELKDSAWFFDNQELQFPYCDEKLFIKYMPDTLNVARWISLTEKDNGNFEAKIEWSENVREIGKSDNVKITKNGAFLKVQSQLFSFPKMECYEGVTASAFNVSEVPAIKSEYLSNFSGDYTLDVSKYKLNIGAKLEISKSDTQYWNANVVNAIVDENGVYDLLLAHSSDKNGDGSIDPGITGKEPFISKQGLFWNHLTLTQSPGSKWTVKWNSTWSDMPYDALQSTPDMTDTFIGPATSKIHYTYRFKFGNPKLNDSGYGYEAESPIEGQNLIATYEFDSDLPTTENWKQILSHIADKLTIPEDWLIDYWWYNTHTLSSNFESCVYKLSDSSEPSLYDYDFFCALKEKPAKTAIYYQEGTFQNTTGAYTVTVSPAGLTYNDKSYSFVDGYAWSNAKDGVTPLRYAYLVTDGEKNYMCVIWWYTNNGNTYINFNEPKESTYTQVPPVPTADGVSSSYGTLIRTLNRQ